VKGGVAAPEQTESGGDPMHTFPHHRLDAYHASLDLAESALRLARQIPRAYHGLADHLIRSAIGMPLLIAEGANRISAGHKRQRFAEANGECGEVAAVAEMADRLALVRGKDPAQVLDLAGRVGAMLSGLVAKFS
jgi:four helix bundle protein